MKASVRDIYGPPEVIRLEDMKRPEPGENDILVRVHASSVNRTDCGILRGKPFIIRFFTGFRRPKRNITGTEFSGVVEETGSEVSRFRVGESVFGFLDGGAKSNAEYLVLKEDHPVEKVPDNISLQQAAVCSEGAHYAYNFIRKVNVRSGDSVLVNGGTGAIGSAMVQLLRHFGAEVSAVCRGEHFDAVRSLGATELFDYTSEDFTKTDGRYRYIFDAVGKSTFGRCRKLLEPGGVYISSELGPGAQNTFLPLWTAIFSREKVKFPFPVDIPGSLRLIRELMEKGEFEPLMDRVYPLEEIVDAYRYVETEQKVGNVVIDSSAERGQ